MRDPRQSVTETELSILEFLWDTGPSTKRAIADALYPAQRDSDVATVQKLLQRLEAKGHVARDRSLMAHVFSAAAPKNEFVGRQLEAFAEKLSGGSLAPLVMHLVEGRRLTKRERNKLRALLDEEA
ncbi:MAG: transcriptional regulator [Planctomycetaceae bacterium]|nr:transcriptional regulator [Planctomycetaceae bacterium]